MPVTASALAGALISRGMDPGELPGKQSLYAAVIDRPEELVAAFQPAIDELARGAAGITG